MADIAHPTTPGFWVFDRPLSDWEFEELRRLALIGGSISEALRAIRLRHDRAEWDHTTLILSDLRTENSLDVEIGRLVRSISVPLDVGYAMLEFAKARIAERLTKLGCRYEARAGEK